MLLSPLSPSLKPVCLKLNRLPQLGDRFLLPRTRPRTPQPFGVAMAETSRVGSGSSRKFGVPGESDAILGSGDSPRRQATGWVLVEARLNRMSKWLVSGCFAFAALWKHDAEIMWVLMGAVVNTLLSSLLKRMFNHERPTPALRSDPGMPSSHAQSFFYAAGFLVISSYYRLGITYLSIILGAAILAIACYFSWLRVSQHLHTLSQILVGGIVGSTFSALWFALWHLLVREAFASSLTVRILVILCALLCCVNFVIHVIRHWFMDEQ
ncbi:hypothetical protein ABZP36_033068 [Zizania latifolia]